MTEPAADSSTPASAAPSTSGPATPGPAPDGALPVPDGGIPGRRFLVVNGIAMGVAVVLLAVALVLPRGALGSPAPGGARPVPTAPTPVPAPGEEGKPTFALSLWDDGKAEVSRYHVTAPLYGKAASFERVHVVAKELFDPARRTRAEKPAAGVVDSIKLVAVDDVPTGRADSYRQALTARVARAEPLRLLEASHATLEWCGTSFALLVPRGADLLRHVHSWGEGEGDRDDALPAATVLEDQLALSLRGGDLAIGARRELPALLPTLATSQKPATQPAPATVEVLGDETVALPAGAVVARRVRVQSASGAATTYWLEPGEPHLLLRWESSDGRQGLLASSGRSAYWRDDPNTPCPCEKK